MSSTFHQQIISFIKACPFWDEEKKQQFVGNIETITDEQAELFCRDTLPVLQKEMQEVADLLKKQSRLEKEYYDHLNHVSHEIEKMMQDDIAHTDRVHAEDVLQGGFQK